MAAKSFLSSRRPGRLNQRGDTPQLARRNHLRQPLVSSAKTEHTTVSCLTHLSREPGFSVETDKSQTSSCPSQERCREHSRIFWRPANVRNMFTSRLHREHRNLAVLSPQFDSPVGRRGDEDILSERRPADLLYCPVVAEIVLQILFIVD